MPMTPNVSATAWQAALSAFAGAVGTQWVYTSDEDVALYRDAYSPLWGEAEERRAAAAVAPREVAEVQAIVRIANQYRIPLFPISTGRNLGYGGSAPNLSGSVIVDLKRMNRIIEVNDRRHFAIVEPGVSYFDLYRYIRERGLNVWVDVPDPGWGSVLGNALDHGVGHTWLGYRDHFGSHCGLEVVLPNGELLRTGMGAMPGAATFGDFRYGFGPHVDGLFAQAGFGIGTRMGIHLMPAPEAYLRRRVHVPRRQDLIPLVDVANQLEDAGLIGRPVYESPLFTAQFQDPALRAIGLAADVWNGNAIDRYAADKGLAPWTLGVTFYGPEPVIQASWQRARAKFEQAIPGARFEDVEALRFPLDAAAEEAVKHKVLVGIPNLNIFSLGARSAMNPEPTDGHLLFSPILERSGEAVLKAQQLFTEGMREMGLDFPMAYGPFTAPYTWIPRAFALTTGFPVSRTDSTLNRRSRDTMRKLIELWRDENDRSWLATAPLIQMQRDPDKRTPYPLSIAEQRLLFSELPDHLARMALFKVNTGLREQEVVHLSWKWEIQVPELNTSVFVVPRKLVKNGRDRYVVLNRVARSIVESCRGQHPERVFTRRGQPVARMYNSGWKCARRRAAARYPEVVGHACPEGFSAIRVHDLKHTFGHRLRAAGVGFEDRKVLLGHKSDHVTTHYSAPEISSLIAAAERVCELESRKSHAMALVRPAGERVSV